MSAHPKNVFAALAVMAATGFAQEPDWVDVDHPRAHFVIVDRNREGMRFGEEPLEIGGIEQGGNEFRSRTPILQHAVSEVARIDVDEAYQRKLAMYDSGATFSSPMRALPSPKSSASRSLGAPRATADGLALAVQGNAASSLGAWAWVGSLGFAVLVLGLFLHRHSHLLRTSDAPAPSLRQRPTR